MHAFPERPFSMTTALDRTPPPFARTLAALACLLFAAAGPAAATGPAEPLPAHESFTLDSRQLGETRRLNVYLPPRYAVDADARYPVLYMPDGGLQEDFPHVAATVDRAIRAGQMRAMIVVGIENTQRRRDMTGPTEAESDRAIAPRVGGSAAFRAFLAQELMPQVRRRYRCGGGDALVGESLAGLFVMETFFLQPELFDTYVALSPSLWWNGKALATSAAQRLKEWPAQGPKKVLYFATASDDDLDEAARKLAEVFRANAPARLDWRFQPWSGLQHSTIYRGASPSVFRTLFAPPPGPRGG